MRFLFSLLSPSPRRAGCYTHFSALPQRCVNAPAEVGIEVIVSIEVATRG